MAMEYGGNFTVNSIFEAKLTKSDRQPEPNSEPKARKKYAKEKYIAQPVV